MASNFWGDVLKLVIPAGFVILALTVLSIIGVGIFGIVRLVRLAIFKDTKFYFMADVVDVFLCACGCIILLILACICFKKGVLTLRHNLTHSQNPSTSA